MSPIALFALAILAWALVHLARHSPTVRRRLRLLRHGRVQAHARPALDDPDFSDAADDDEPRWTIETTLVGLNISTTVLNETPPRFVRRLGPEQVKTLARAYDLGIVWGAAAMMATVVILAWEGSGLVVWLIRTLTQPSLASRVVRRAIEDTTTTSTGGGGGFGEGIIQPLIPGVTLPLSHAWYLLLSFLLGQIVHEPGHAIVGALSSLTPLLASVHLSPILPSASVTLPSAALRDLPPRERARIAGAGCWHNVVLAALLWIGAAVVPWGQERYVGDVGRGVLSVDEDSSLYSVLPRGAVITRVDDVPLSADSSALSDDIWSSYLTEPSPLALTQNGRVEPHRGWCVPKEWYLNQPEQCSHLDTSLLLFRPVLSDDLHPPSSTSASDSIASPFPAQTENRCLPLHPLLTSTLFDPPSLLPPPVASPGTGFPHCPCADPKRDMCVAVDPKEKIVRILFVMPGEKQSDGGGERKWIIWQGDREQIYLQVTTSSHLPPRFKLSSTYRHLDLFKAYFLLISITLAVFNLLPLPILDGGMLLDAFLEMADGSSSRREEELELIEQGEERGARRFGGRWKRWERTIHWTVGGLGCWVFGGVGVRMLVGG